MDGDGPEIRQACFRADGGELRIDDFNGIVAVGVGVVEDSRISFFIGT